MWSVHHVQLAMPPGGEARAREFYEDDLGMAEIAKPPALAGRGGAWFGLGSVELHLGVEEPFEPARKAHPGLLVEDLDALAGRLRGRGHEVRVAGDLPGHRRFYVSDCFGNRLEFIQPR